MNKTQWFAYGVTFLICLCILLYFFGIKTTSKTPGKLFLPISNGELTETEVKRVLLAISVSPEENLLLTSSDRRAFLVFLQQECAIVELPSLQDVYLPVNIPVWKILVKNYPNAEALILDPANSKNGKISLKLIAKGILRLNL